ncbi:glutathione S-transferase family protein [Achromobacter seleniivolatilans]|uniref:Glutathione S-transferase family protein n=1 Tax=Achromobacter seleniivolatilans TaxID=3047478 RepID=A0ABY9LWY3_9BURK|nr:glutathione S-transferase family protein [Achromobacter sp. R39]WMD18212.1 glutathione S-transferase family protein [Achromobacter sp. R39]
MITLYSYPGLFGLEDNNPYGLKIYAFLKLCRLPFDHRHTIDVQSAPRGQLPYVQDADQAIGDSDAIIAYLKQRYELTIDSTLTPQQQSLDLLIRRTLDDLYWVMSYSRWRDDRYWPLFRKALLDTHPEVTPQQLEAARQYNFQRYHYQGIGRYAPEDAYARGVADLEVISRLIGDGGFLFGPNPGSVDAGIYGFLANIYHYAIDTPLKQFLVSQPGLVRHCNAVRAELG